MSKRNGYFHGNGCCWLLCFLSNEIIAMEYTTMRELISEQSASYKIVQLAASLREKTSKDRPETRGQDSV
jgi:hypothetical protein